MSVVDDASKDRLRDCPLEGCAAGLAYGHTGDVVCENDHHFREWPACAGLQRIYMEDGRYSGQAAYIVVPQSQVTSMLDLGARVHNALVWFGEARFHPRLYDIAVSMGLDSVAAKMASAGWHRGERGS